MDFSFNANTNTGSITPNVINRPREESSFDAVDKLLIVINVLVIIAVGFLFWYQSYLSDQIIAKKNELSKYKNSVAGIPLEEMRGVSLRMNTINDLVKNYVYTSNIFPLLEESIEHKVLYTNFDMRRATAEEKKKDPNNAIDFTLNIKGQADDYKTLVRQIDTLKSDKYKEYFTKVTLDAVNLDDKGIITFSIIIGVKIKGIDPEKLLLLQKGAIKNIFATSTIQSTLESKNSTTSLTLKTNNATSSLATSTQKIATTTTTTITSTTTKVKDLPLKKKTP